MNYHGVFQPSADSSRIITMIAAKETRTSIAASCIESLPPVTMVR